REPKTCRRRLNLSHIPLVNVRYRYALKPLPIAYEGLKGDGSWQLRTQLGLVRIKGQDVRWVRDMGGIPYRTQEHPGGHVVFPEFHGFAEDVGLYTGHLQVRSRGKSVW